MDWKLYYADGSTTFSSDDGDWIDAPARGVMGLATFTDWLGYERTTGDFYVMAPWGNGQPWDCDRWGLMDMLIEMGVMTPDDSLERFSIDELAMYGVKFGRSVDNATWQTLKAWMRDDPDLPRKSARFAHERI